MHLRGSLFLQDQRAIGSSLTCYLVYQCSGIHFQGSFSKNSRLWQLWAQILVPVIFLPLRFPFWGCCRAGKRSHCLVAPSSPEVIEAAAHICMITELACSACSVLWLLSWSGRRKKCQLLLLDALICSTLSGRGIWIWKWAWPDSKR